MAQSDFVVDHLGQTAQEFLSQIVSAIETLEDEKKETQTEIKDKFAEAASNGIDTKVLKLILKRRKRRRTDIETEESILTTYEHALGMIPEDN